MNNKNLMYSILTSAYLPQTKIEPSNNSNNSKNTMGPQKISVDNYNEIVPNLFVGNIVAAQEHSNEFDVIVNCTTHIPFYGPKDNEKQIHLPVLDSPDESEKLYYLIRRNYALERIHTAISNNKRVLIHCHMGAQRSASVAAAYLIVYHKLNIQEAIERVREARPIALIWVNFRKMLNMVDSSL